ncbi:MAG TPA: hypothetical protein VK611_18810, partial [Acidimicrobiales bacterium]|nr:hypothetical protein [Acidimicrobiales bacterium]
LGARFVFRQARGAIPSALRFLGVSGSVDAATVLEHGLGNGQALYRDVRDRTGLVQVLPPALPSVRPLFETAPGGGEPVVPAVALGPGARRSPALDRSEPPPALDPAPPPAPPARPPAPPPARPPAPPTPPARPQPAARGDLATARDRARERRRSPLAHALDPKDPT